MKVFSIVPGFPTARSRRKSTDNAFVESFSGTFRAECQNAHWFTALAETRQIIESWRREYNESRPTQEAEKLTLEVL